MTVEKGSSTSNNDAYNLSDILLEVLILYLDPISFLCLREVCRSGRRTVARYPPSKNTLLALTNNPRRDVRVILNHCLDAARPEPYGFRCCGSSGSWIALVSQMSRLFLLNIINKSFLELPPQMSLLHSGTHSSFNNPFYIRKIIMSSTPNDCEVVALLFDYRMAKCTVGDNVWTEVVPTSGYSKHKWIVTDAAFVGKELYILDIDMEVCTFDLPTGKATKLEILYDREMHEASAKKYLVVTPDGELMLVLRIWDVPLDQVNRKTSGFQVFKLGKQRSQNFRWLKWVKMDDLDGNVMLVSRSCSLCVPWREYPELEENSIYFAENLTGDGGEGVASVDAKVFRMIDQVIESVENGNKFPLFLFLFHSKSVF